MFYCYILQSSVSGKFYIGSTANPEDRVRRHNSGYSKATKAGIPWILVYCEEFDTRSQAIKRELEIKSWKSHSRIQKMILQSK